MARMSLIFANLRNTGATAQGEHFAALEQPALLADEVSAFFRELR
jgi:hypothetical protein